MSDKPLPTVAETQAFFMRASKETYASGQEPQSVAFMPGAKTMTFTDGDFYYVDLWVSGKADSKNRRHSVGNTYIYHANRLIWSMRYSGWWQVDVPGVIDFLKHALATATEFLGGRGPREYYEDGELRYQNLIVYPYSNRFDRFGGHDFIIKTGQPGIEVYWHNYYGGTLGNLLG